MLKWVLIGVLVLIVLVAILFLVGLFLSVYYSIPYDEWVEKQKKQKAKKERKRIMIDKLDAFLAELEKRGIQISGDTAFLCSDGAVLFVQNERGGVDVSIVRNLVPIDYSLGITDEDVENWRNTEELFEELGGSENGGD